MLWRRPKIPGMQFSGGPLSHLYALLQVAPLVLMLATAALHAQTVTQGDPSGSWRIFTDTAEPKQICFIATQPVETLPKGANRSPIYFYVSTWPKDGIKTELSVKLGYPIKKGSEPLLTIGTEKFKMFIKDDRAFIADATRELKLLDAMKKGSKMTIEGVSERGTETADTYSLGGLSRALQTLATNCP